MMFRNSKPLGREIFRTRGFSAQVAVSSRLKASEYEDAKKFSDIPTLSRFELFRRFRPGGIFQKASMVEIQRSLRDELGTIYQLPGMIGQNNMVTTFDADDVEYVHRNEGTYPFRRGMETLKYYRSNVRPDIFSVGGLIVEQGHEWQKMRSASNPIMMKPQTVKSYIPIIDEIVKEFVDNIPKVMDENGELPGNFHEYLNRWSLESITAITLEKRLGLTSFKDTDGLGMQIQRAIRRIISMGMEFEMKPSVWRFYKTKGFHELMKAYDELTELSEKIIDEAVKKFEENPSNLPEENQGILFKLLQKDRKYAVVMAFDLIFGGVDTTSSAVAFMIYCLAKNPEKQEKLRAELMKIMPDENTPLTEGNMKNLPFLRAVMKESLRLYPPATLNMRRVTSDNFVLRGYQIPKGVDILLGMMSIYHDPKYFEKATEFIPERFLRPESTVEACPMNLRSKHSFAYLPFGYGPRFCVGKRFAEMEIETFLCRVIRKYKVEWHHPDMTLQPAMVLLPGSELRFRLKKI